MEIDPDFFWFRLTAIVECIVLGEVCQIKVLGSGILPSSQVLLITNEGERGLDVFLAKTIHVIIIPPISGSSGKASSTQTGWYLEHIISG